MSNSKNTFGGGGGSSSGGGTASSSILIVKKTDEPRVNDTVLSDDAELVLIGLKPDTCYKFESFIYHESDAAFDVRRQYSLPAGAIGIFSYDLDAINSSSFSLSSALILPGAGAGNPKIHTEVGFIKTAGTAGDLVFRWRQGVSGATASIVKTGSWIKVETV